ncbi:MAG: rhodanese-like domain-containing protein [Methylococcaceae bacterium]|nr:rhodanese-like domain-containing protein [Methylococcaceae bacterium]
MIENLDPQHAWDLLQQNPDAVLVDVRTKAEYTDIGHPIGAVHIAWQEQFGSPVNPNFIAEVNKVAPDYNTPVLLLCRSGQRSLSAAKALEQSGYKTLINIINGFEGDPDNNQQRGNLNGWRFHGLPWQQN